MPRAGAGKTLAAVGGAAAAGDVVVVGGVGGEGPQLTVTLTETSGDS